MSLNKLHLTRAPPLGNGCEPRRPSQCHPIALLKSYEKVFWLEDLSQRKAQNTLTKELLVSYMLHHTFTPLMLHSRAKRVKHLETVPQTPGLKSTSASVVVLAMSPSCTTSRVESSLSKVCVSTLCFSPRQWPAIQMYKSPHKATRATAAMEISNRSFAYANCRFARFETGFT